jgi:hypothetical protein
MKHFHHCKMALHISCYITVIFFIEITLISAYQMFVHDLWDKKHICVEWINIPSAQTERKVVLFAVTHQIYTSNMCVTFNVNVYMAQCTSSRFYLWTTWGVYLVTHVYSKGSEGMLSSKHLYVLTPTTHRNWDFETKNIPQVFTSSNQNG